MPLICLFGPDGSGKSTLARALAEMLSKKGFMVRIAWMRGTHTLSSLLARFLRKFTTFQGLDNPYYGINVPQNLRRLWQLVEFTSAISIILLKFILPSALGSWVIAERYAPDFITWVSLTTDDRRYPESIEAKFLLALSSRAHAKIYVTAALKELSRRKKGANPNFVNNQLKLYDRIALAIRAERLDTTNKSVNESLEEALSILGMNNKPLPHIGGQ